MYFVNQLTIIYIFFNTLEIVYSEKNSYNLQIYNVQTADGYVLELHRIIVPHRSKQLLPVLFGHSLLVSSKSWIIRDKKRSLALTLAGMGYDVWLGNFRGNTFARQHISLDPNKKEFWNFSFHEYGCYDLPAQIDFILNETGKKKLNYIGHSQGTTAFFILASQKPEYNKKLTYMVALAPVAYLSNITNIIANVLRQQQVEALTDAIVDAFNLHEVLPFNDVFSSLLQGFCTYPYEDICLSIIGIIGGKAAIEKQFLNTVIANFPSGCSYKHLKHFLQEVNSGYFRQYDYGVEENLIKYNQKEPPEYDVKKVTAPVALFYSKTDVLAGYKNVERLKSELPNVVHSYLLPNEDFAHIDFVFSQNIDVDLNNEVLDFIVKFEGKNKKH